MHLLKYLGPFGKISSEQNLQKMVFPIDVYTFYTHHTVYGVFYTFFVLENAILHKENKKIVRKGQLYKRT